MEYPSSIDDAEIEHFRTFSKLWWSETSEVKSLFAMNAIRVPFVRDGLIKTGKLDESVVKNPKPLANTKILDAGCGAGYLTEALAKLGAKAVGLDPCKELTVCAEEHARFDKDVEVNASYICDSIENHSKTHAEKYDAVVASEVLEHVSEPKLFLESCVKTVKPGGSIFVTTVNKTFYSWLAGIIMAEYVLRVIPKGSHDWEKFITPDEVKQILEENNCEVQQVRGTFYNFVTNKWTWSSCNWLTYAVHAVKNEKPSTS